MPRSAVQTTLSSVRSRCTACRGQVGCHDVELRPGRRRGIRHQLPSRRVGVMRREQLDDAIGDPRIPLQHAVEARGGRSPARARTRAGGELAHARDDRGREVGVAGEGAAGEVLDDADAERALARVGDDRAWRAGGIRRSWWRRAVAGAGGRDARPRPFLRVELGRGEGGVRDLHDADGLAAASPVAERESGEEVLVLLAAERRELDVEPPAIARRSRRPRRPAATARAARRRRRSRIRPRSTPSSRCDMVPLSASTIATRPATPPCDFGRPRSPVPKYRSTEVPRSRGRDPVSERCPAMASAMTEPSPSGDGGAARPPPARRPSRARRPQRR